MGFIRKAICWALVAVLIQIAVKFYVSLDTNKMAYNHAPGRCRYLQGVNEGSEDAELLDNGALVITSGLRYMNVSETRNVVGKMFTYKFPATAEESAKEPRAVELKIQSKSLDIKHFNPHGISKYVDKGSTLIYVVNHGLGGDTIERFTLDKEKNSLVHTKTIRHPLIHAANDLILVGLDKFYVTNDHYFSCECLRAVEFITKARLGSIVYYDGTNAKIVSQWLPAPNGINVDKSQKKLYVASPTTKSLMIYDVQKDMNITHDTTLDLFTAIDNVIVEQDTGDLWIGSHPVLHELIEFINKPKSTQAPSQVIRVQLPKKPGQKAIVNEIYSNDGRTLSASTVAVPHKNHLFIGTVTHKALICELNRDLFLS